MIKIILFIFRLHLFFISYLIYCLNILVLLLNFKILSREIFIFSAYICSLSLGIKYKIDNKSKIFLKKNGIHIVNHDSPLDIFIAQCFFRIPTITTVNNHLNKILPFFRESLINFGHFNFDHLNQRERKSAYLFLKNICSQQKNVLIYPSGSIYTAIEKRFSRSISKLSMTNNLKVIAWRFYYKDIDGTNLSYKKDVLKFVFHISFLQEI